MTRTLQFYASGKKWKFKVFLQMSSLSQIKKAFQKFASLCNRTSSSSNTRPGQNEDRWRFISHMRAKFVHLLSLRISDTSFDASGWDELLSLSLDTFVVDPIIVRLSPVCQTFPGPLIVAACDVDPSMTTAPFSDNSS